MYFSVKGIVKVMFIVILCSLLVRGPQFEKYRRSLPLQAKFRAVCVVSSCALRHPQPQQSGRQHILAVHSQNHVCPVFFNGPLRSVQTWNILVHLGFVNRKPIFFTVGDLFFARGK
jgi:hypothetical protein